MNMVRMILVRCWLIPVDFFECWEIGKLGSDIQSFNDRPLHHKATTSKELRRPEHGIFDSDPT